MPVTRMDCFAAILEYTKSGRHSSRAFESLISLLQDRSPKLRTAAARTVGVYAQNGYKSEEALRRLLPLLDARDTAARIHAAVAVGELARWRCLDPSALPRLAGCLGSRDLLLVYHSLDTIEVNADNGVWDRATWFPLLRLANDPEFGSWALSVLSKCGFDQSFGNESRGT